MPSLDDAVAAAHGRGLAAEVDLRLEVARMLSAGESGRSEIERFLRAGSSRDWMTFDHSMRAYWYGLEDPQRSWWRRAVDAIRPDASKSTDVLAIGLASMDRDGRVREEAVRRLALEPDSLAGPFLALRTTDWVDQISTLAIQILLQRIAIEADVLICSAPILFALSERQRGSGIESVALHRAAADVAIRAALLSSGDRRTRRRLIVDEEVRAAASLEELVELSQTDPDAVVATAAGVEAVSKGGASGPVLERLLKGPAPVRRAVLDVVADRAQALDLAKRHLFDRSPTVRAAAQRAYRRFDGDPTAAYRAAFQRSEHVPIAVTELALLGSEGDRDAVIRALRSDDVATRRAAVNSVRWIARDRLAELIAPLLWDGSARVTRAVERRLRTKARDLDPRLLVELAVAPQSHQRRAAYRLMRRRSLAERVEADLIALADADDSVRQDAIADLRSWLQRGAASAPRADIATRRRLSMRLDGVGHLLPPDDVAKIRFHAGLRREDLRTRG